MTKPSIVIALLLTLLCGCSSAPVPQSHYLLTSPNGERIANDDAPLLEVDIELAEHLNRPGIAYRINESEQISAKQHRWAQPLYQQLEQQLVHRLRQKQQQYWPMANTPSVPQYNKQQLLIRFHAFNGTYDGNAELSGEWLLIDTAGNMQRNREFKINQPLESEGYPSLINALTQGVDKLAKSIADGL